jgi:hypothetical protein
VTRAPAEPSPDQRSGLAARLADARAVVGPHALPVDVPVALLRGVAAIDAGAPEALADAVRPVLGTGVGLTPSADDAVAGLLLAARSWRGEAAAATLSAAGALLAPGLTRRTTAVSAGLLRHAADGRGAPEVVRAVEHLTGRAVAADPQQVLGDLVRLGHSSGRDTALGVLTYLEHRVNQLDAGNQLDMVDPVDRSRPATSAQPLTARESA